jgi:Putative adhesin
MNRHSQIAAWFGATLGTAGALVMLAVGAHASDYRGAVTEEFHQTYTLTPDGRVELDNINGPVHISTWDRNEVKVDAIKSASTKERLDETRIEIDAGKDYVSIRTKYRDRDQTWNDDNWHNNPPSVEYTVTVPLGAHLDEIKLINGSLDVAGVSGEVRASCINGKLEAKDLSGRAQLSTINGRLDARFSHLSGSALELNSVNGSVKLTIPSDAKAEIEANTVSGDIENDFGLHVNRHRYVGRDMRGELAGGGARIKLENVNGRIEIRHAEDGRALSPIKDLGGRDRDRDEDNDDDSEI